MSKVLNQTVRAGSNGKTFKASVSDYQLKYMLPACAAFKPTPEQTDELNRYVATGHLSRVSADLAETLRTQCKQARDAMSNPSQKKRVWPRKMASVIVNR